MRYVIVDRYQLSALTKSVTVTCVGCGEGGREKEAASGFLGESGDRHVAPTSTQVEGGVDGILECKSHEIVLCFVGRGASIAPGGEQAGVAPEVLMGV